MSKVQETVLEIDLHALEHNYNHLRSKIKKDTKFLGVVKAFAYGSDSVAIAKKLENLGADYLAVAYTNEGVALREAGVTLPILVLHPQRVCFPRIIEHRLEPSLYSPLVLTSFLRTAKALQQTKYPVHLKLNTGLNRIGFSEKEVDFLIEQLQGAKEVKVASLFSHLAASEDINEREFSLSQIEAFKRIATQLLDKIEDRPLLHLLNTSGIINYPQAQFDMVRSGIGIYGYGNEASEDAQLIPIATLKTIISQIHKIEPNQSVGYNRGFIATSPTVTATLPLGHADGLGRIYGNHKGHVWVNGTLAPIIGNVCMDMVMIDITGIKCQEGDEVIVFGKAHSADTMAAYANTISYELLTGISQRIKRVYIGK